MVRFYRSKESIILFQLCNHKDVENDPLIVNVQCFDQTKFMSAERNWFEPSVITMRVEACVLVVELYRSHCFVARTPGLV